MIEPGSVLGERYKLTKTLGEGGMANVYLAHDLILDRDVAVKVLRLDLKNDPDTLRRFQREAMATLELSHPNIVSIYDVGESSDQQYLVMEYVQGTDLKKYIAMNFPIPYARVIALMTQILSAVQSAHDHHIIHRDLKPQNIMVDENGLAKITDFGIAVALSDNSMTQTNSLLGSVHYISPEQARGSMPTKQSDIYSLGIILYEMLTGSVPFEGSSAVTIALKHFQQEMPAVRDFDPRIPQALENVVLKATAKEPAQRYTSVSAMSDDLSTALSVSRAHEAQFVPSTQEDLGETKVMTDLPRAVQEASVQAAVDKTAADQGAPAQVTPVKKRSRKWWFIGAGVVLAALALVVFLIWPAGETKVPDVTGLTLSQAQTRIEASDLTLGEHSTVASTKVKKGHVITSDPEAGQEVKKHSNVNLMISSGTEKFTVKNYVGETYADVAKDLRDAGFTVHKVDVATSTAAAGTIINQSIQSGTKVVASKTDMKLTVAADEPASTSSVETSSSSSSSAPVNTTPASSSTSTSSVTTPPASSSSSSVDSSSSASSASSSSSAESSSSSAVVSESSSSAEGE